MGFFDNIGQTGPKDLEKLFEALKCKSRLFHSDLDYFTYVYHQLRELEEFEILNSDLGNREIYGTYPRLGKVKFGLFNELVGRNIEPFAGQYQEIIARFLDDSKKELKKGKIDVYIAAIITEGQPDDLPKEILANDPKEFCRPADKDRAYRIVMESNSDIKETKLH